MKSVKMPTVLMVHCRVGSLEKEATFEVRFEGVHC